MPMNTYTLLQAADHIGIREDTLTSMLPDVGVDMAGRNPPTLVQAEYEALYRLVERLKVLHKEGMEM